MKTLVIRYSPAKSTVGILKDGSVLELRRGEKTKWASDEDRRTWPSMDDWLTTLPRVWPSVEAWAHLRPDRVPPCPIHTATYEHMRACGSYIDFSVLAQVARPVRPLLAYFLASEEATGCDIENALLSYIDTHRLNASKEIRLDDFLVVLTGLTWRKFYSLWDIVFATVERQVHKN